MNNESVCLRMSEELDLQASITGTITLMHFRLFTVINNQQSVPFSAGWTAVVQLFQAAAAWCCRLGI